MRLHFQAPAQLHKQTLPLMSEQIFRIERGGACWCMRKKVVEGSLLGRQRKPGKRSEMMWIPLAELVGIAGVKEEG